MDVSVYIPTNSAGGFPFLHTLSSIYCFVDFLMMAIQTGVKLYLIVVFYLFIYLFMAVLGLHFCAKAFSSCGKRGPLFIAVRGPLTIAASLVAEHRLQTRRLSSCGPRAQLLRGMWDLPRPGLEPVSPALAGRLSTTAPPGKPPHCSFDLHFSLVMLSILSCVCWQSVYLLWRNVYLGSLPIFGLGCLFICY